MDLKLFDLWSIRLICVYTRYEVDKLKYNDFVLSNIDD